MITLVPTRTALLLFDVHTCLQAVDDSKLFKPEFRFLSAPIDYNHNYEIEGFARKTEHFSIRPLKAQEIAANHFWKRLPSRNAWYAHRPLVALPAALAVELVAEDLGLRVSADPWVFLWPWGWSANLRVELEGEIPLQALAELTASFKSPHERSAFVLDGKPAKPTHIFQRLGNWISSDIYSQAPATEARIGLTRHFVISILTSVGEALPYDPIPAAGPRRAGVEDRRELHSILLGRAVSGEELVDREHRKPRPFLLTEFTGTAFALTDYEQGSVLVLPGLKPAEERGKELKRSECLTGNVENCAALSFGLAAVLEDAQSYENPGHRVSALLRSACFTLLRMWNEHANRLWNGYLMNKRVQKSLQRALDDARSD